MPAHKSWSRDWGQATNTALSSLKAYRRQIMCDLNTRQRIIKDAQRCAPNISQDMAQLIRAPLTGLR